MLEKGFNHIAKFHHLGLAAKDFKNPLDFFTKIGYSCSLPIKDDKQNVELLMRSSKYFPNIELIKPIGEESPIMVI